MIFNSNLARLLILTCCSGESDHFVHRFGYNTKAGIRHYESRQSTGGKNNEATEEVKMALENPENKRQMYSSQSTHLFRW